MISPEKRQEYVKQIELGDKVSAFLQSEEWLTVIKPIIDSMIKGLVDIRDIKKSQLTSNKKAEVLVEGRALAADYLSEIETLINAIIDEGNVARKLLEKDQAANELFRERQ